MYWILNFLGLLRIVLRRQQSYLGLVVALVAGFVVAVAMVVSIPLYADAIGYRALRAELVPESDGTQRPPFAFMFSHIDPNDKPLPIEAFERADAYFANDAAGQLGLPLQQLVRYANSDKLGLFPQSGAANVKSILAVNMAFAEGIEDKIDLLEGTFPPGSTTDDGPAPVMINWRMAEETGIQLGEQYLVEDERRNDEFKLLVEVVGVWRATNDRDPYWFVHPDSLENVLLVPEQTYTARVIPQGPRARAQTLWYMTLNGDRIRNSDVPGLIQRIVQVTKNSNEVLPGVKLPVSPRQGMEQQYERVRLLTVSLTVFSLPILALIGYFIIMIASLVVQRQQSEIAVLRSRGASRSEVLGIYLLEGTILGIIALLIGTLLGPYTATLMGWTRSFLSFVPRNDVTVAISDDVIRVGMWVVALMIAASVIPAVGSSAHTIISYKQNRARSLGKPFWQRSYLDLLLLVPAWYGYQQLNVRGTISILGRDTPGGDPFSNPLLVLAPMLSQVALALVSLRVFPILTSLISWLIGKLPGVSALLALRYLTRASRAYIGPVLLLILTVSLATFTASMAETLDSHLSDQVHYEVGTEMRISDFGVDSQRQTTPNAPSAAPLIDEPRWQFLPVTEYLKLPGVTAATRVTRSTGEVRTTDSNDSATVLGIDRLDFPGAAHWRDDYADQSLGALMNALGANPAGILVSRDYMNEHSLSIGDRLTIEMKDVGNPVTVPFIVAAATDLFPSVYREDGPFFVANAEYLFEQEGDVFPYEVWLNVVPGTTPDQVRAGINEMRLPSIISENSPQTILVAQNRAERQGLYGLLSVGFLGSALLTGLGFLFYALVSFQQRFVELGMLRAIGLSIRQMLVLLVWEQFLIIATGIVLGTAIGVWVSNLYIPFLQVGGEYAQSPPFIVRIAWDQIQIVYLIFTVLLVMALGIVAAFLVRMKIFQAIKLGEAV